MKATFSVFRNFSVLDSLYGFVGIAHRVPCKQERDEDNQCYWYTFRSRRDWELSEI